MAAVAYGALPSRALSGGEVEFPANFRSGLLYATVDRADLKQYREFYAPASALAAIREGKPLPVGTVVTMLLYTVRRDSAGQPITDAAGRFVKEEPLAFLVMEKRYAGDARQVAHTNAGKWRFQAFKPDGRRALEWTGCVECHQQRRDHDFVFTGDRMKAASPAAAP